MRHIAYAESEFTTDEHLAALVLDYSAILARNGSADTVTVPGRIADGRVEQVSLLVGPASQMTTWADDEPFGEDVSAAVADLERRIRALTATISASSVPTAPAAIDDFDDLA